MTMLGLDFDVVVSNFDEQSLDKSSFSHPYKYVEENARRKAQEVVQRFLRNGEEQPSVVIGADTVVVLDDAILEKPNSEGQAMQMLKSLSGRDHVVITGVAIFTRNQPDCAKLFSECTKVRFAELSDIFITEYIRSGEPMDKAGSYGIQGIGGSMVKCIEGCYFNVMGLPMHRLSLELANLIERGNV
eukprot:CAMPEP_0198737014 /NCGR_PEP_ID=MMETSP1475-20131203/67651_1 /TAXON_ID= ORGANISM="Unidentified sp., Strain CCMP1999" /NCGR_SAMPLE_ID=MMETSP1475 /ASSEMBLY_ACC=CAM_ASM_001111 /LENGTH=186 /DNA_ID=CAMNT_0044500869 /DNA_START=260 /DNA_END=820 /DNA_ORIENTATION=+